MKLEWTVQLRDLGRIRERGSRDGMILDTPSGEVFVPLTVEEVKRLGGEGLLFQPLRMTLDLEVDKG